MMSCDRVISTKETNLMEQINNSDYIHSSKSFNDFGGIDGVIDRLNVEVIIPLLHPHISRRFEPVKGNILLHGPPGCGKSNLAQAIANEAGVPFYQVDATDLVSPVSGASVQNIQELFSKAYKKTPSIVFIDEIDAIASKIENSKSGLMESGDIVTQLIECMDLQSQTTVKSVDDKASNNINSKYGYVLVIGATSRPNAIHPALRRPGRFDREILLTTPNERARLEILSKMISNVQVEGALDLVKVAKSTPGFVGADLLAVVNEARKLTWKRVVDERKELSKEKIKGIDWRMQVWTEEDLNNVRITMADLEEAVKMVQPIFNRKGCFDIPNVTWDDVGGHHSLRKDFRYIIRRIKFPEIYEGLGLDMPTGFLLYGPPGCGKTLIAKAVANEAGANFIRIKGPEFLNEHEVESEMAVQTIFNRARACSPCIIFFDEVDALTTKNGKEGGSAVHQILKQLLIELDGRKETKGVYVIGATNWFGKLVYVPLPNPDERGMILKALARDKSVDSDVDLMALGKDHACDNFSGADLSSLMHEAVMESIDDQQTSPPPRMVKYVHFKRASENVSPSVSYEQIELYEQWSKRLKVAQE